MIKHPYYIQGNENDKRTLLALRTAPKGSKLARQIGNMPYPDEPYKIGDILYVRERFCKGLIEYGEEPDGRAAPYVVQSHCDEESTFIHYEYCLREGIGIEDVVWCPSTCQRKPPASG